MPNICEINGNLIRTRLDFVLASDLDIEEVNTTVNFMIDFFEKKKLNLNDGVEILFCDYHIGNMDCVLELMRNHAASYYSHGNIVFKINDEYHSYNPHNIDLNLQQLEVFNKEIRKHGTSIATST